MMPNGWNRRGPPRHHSGGLMDAERLIDAYLAHEAAAGHSPATLRLHRYWLGRLRGVYPDVVAVSGSDLVGWVTGHSWSRNTLKSVRSTLCGFYGWTVEVGVVGVNPASALPVVRTVAGVPHPVGESVFVTAIGRADARDALMLALAGYCGLRRGEIARLRGEDVTDGGLIVRGKGGRDRLVPLPAAVRAALTGCPTGWVFPGRFDGHMNVDAVGKAMRRALGFASSAHALRHRFATRAYAGTHDLLAVQRLLGHASPATTQIYVAVSDDALRAAVAAAA